MAKMILSDYGFRSRQDDRYAGPSLADFETQERFFTAITESEKPKVYHLRKLREAIIAGHRHDDFTLKVYQFSVYCCIVEREWPELTKSLGRIQEIVPKCSLLSIEMAELYLLFRICCLSSQKVLVADAQSILTFLAGLEPKVEASQPIQSAKALLLAFNSLNYLFICKFYDECDMHRKILMGCILPHFRTRIVQAFKKAYYTYPVAKLRDFLVLRLDNEWDSFVSDTQLVIRDDNVIFKVVKTRQASKAESVKITM